MAYQGAWLAVRLLVDAHGEAAVVRMYRRARSGGLATGLRDELGTTPGQLRAAWRHEIGRLVHG
jgi:hypothetical protein